MELRRARGLPPYAPARWNGGSTLPEIGPDEVAVMRDMRASGETYAKNVPAPGSFTGQSGVRRQGAEGRGNAPPTE